MQIQSAQLERFRWLLFAGVCLVCIGLLYFRRPDAFLNPQFYGEDGRDFFAQAFADGWRSLKYRTMGYLVLYARSVDVVGLAVGVPIVHMPMLHTVFCIVAYLMLWIAIFLRFPAPLVGRLLAILATALVPLGHEIWMNTAAVQWPMALMIPVLCWGAAPRGAIMSIFTAFALVLASFTGPSAALMLPVVFCQQVLGGTRSLRKVPWTVWIVMVAAVVTMITLLKFGGVQRAEGELHVLDPGHVQMIFKQIWFVVLAQKVEHVPNVIAAILAVVGIAAYAWQLWKCKRVRGFVWSCAVGAAAVVVVTLIGFRSDSGSLSPYGIGTRYFYLPAVFMAWSVLASIEHYDRIRTALIGSVCGWWLGITFGMVGRLTFMDSNWPAYAKLLEEQDEPLIVPITPTGWIMYVSKEDATSWPVPWRPEE